MIFHRKLCTGAHLLVSSLFFKGCSYVISKQSILAIRILRIRLDTSAEIHGTLIRLKQQKGPANSTDGRFGIRIKSLAPEPCPAIGGESCRGGPHESGGLA
jgi:hypothetical protein